MSRTKGIELLMARGFLSEDVDMIYVGDKPGLTMKKYYVQESGEENAKAYWTELTYDSPQKFLRDRADKYPDMMILKTKYETH
jgi:hypothetical protein